MTDNPNPTNPDAVPVAGTPAEAPTQPRVTQRIIGQYVRDLSFENVVMQKGLSGDLQPEVSVQVNLDARRRPIENQHEVITKLKVTSKAKNTGEVLFLLEVEYGGIFHIEGLSNEQLLPYLMVECPRITFPYLRRIVSDVTRDGGFPPLNLDMIDFLAIYRNELMRRVQQQQQQQAAAVPNA